jgi:glucosamine-6-phosphate deaminase
MISIELLDGRLGLVLSRRGNIRPCETRTTVILRVFDDKRVLGQAAAAQAEAAIRRAIAERGSARIIAATGASQFEFLDALTAASLDWERVEMFHLDEYVGLPIEHPASFRKYLMERLIQKTGILKYHLLDGEGDPEEVICAVGRAVAAAPIDVAFAGIGENGHLAFNDPPADFETEEPYLLVTLDQDCRQQQVGEGWFPSLGEVPQKAMSMSICRIMQSREIICIVPDARKARAVKSCFEGEITPMAPASILRRHDQTTVYLDTHSAALLSPELIARTNLQ